MRITLQESGVRMMVAGEGHSIGMGCCDEMVVSKDSVRMKLI